jgi:hypothetical protein
VHGNPVTHLRIRPSGALLACFGHGRVVFPETFVRSSEFVLVTVTQERERQRERKREREKERKR